MKLTDMIRACALGALLLAPVAAQMKVEGAGAPPSEASSLSASLSKDGVKVLKDDGSVLCEMWFVNAIASGGATEESASFAGTPTGALFGVARFPARHSDRRFLMLSILGLALHWFGDSLDGRLAYYRNTPRKWYGWALDITVDWTSACFIGLGFYFYLETFKIVAFVFVVAYGGSMIVALLRYRISDKYTIDTFMFGPTELRLLLAAVLLIEFYRPNTLLQFGFAGSLVLVIINTIDSYKVLKLADQKDRDLKMAK
jgi:hypothetical protein